MKPTYALRFFFEWGGGALWAADSPTAEAFGHGPIEDRLPLAPATLDRLRELSEWHDTSLNWAYPPDPGPWRQEECDRFNQEARAIYRAILRELGAAFAVRYEQHDSAEDPDLDAYLRDPRGFRRA